VLFWVNSDPNIGNVNLTTLEISEKKIGNCINECLVIFSNCSLDRLSMCGDRSIVFFFFFLGRDII